MKKILILDDNPDILDMVEQVLTYENFKVKAMSLSTQLMTTLVTDRPDLILLDYLLSDGNGGELCKRIKSDPELSAIPVIIFSAYAAQNTDFSYYGCDAVIHKPFDLAELIDTVNALLTAG